jgi:uncharacterized protein (TIGR02246 family)
MKSPLLVGVYVTILTFLGPGETVAQQDDVSAIRALQEQQAAAWNRHDAAAYADLFTEDADLVNVLGWWWKGRVEIERKLSDAFAYVFSESELSITEVDVRFLGPDHAITHVRWTMAGAKAPPGAPAPPREGIQIQVLRKAPDGWRIVSFQNTNSVPETPFPRAAPSPPSTTPRVQATKQRQLTKANASALLAVATLQPDTWHRST